MGGWGDWDPPLTLPPNPPHSDAPVCMLQGNLRAESPPLDLFHEVYCFTPPASEHHQKNRRFCFDHVMDFKPAVDSDWLTEEYFSHFLRDGCARGDSSQPPLRVLPLCQVTVYLDVAATVAVMRAHADSYVTVLAPLLARWLKRRRKEHGKTCERSEDFSERELFYVLWFFDPVHAQNHSAALQRDYKGTSRLFCSSLFFPSFRVCSPG